MKYFALFLALTLLACGAEPEGPEVRALKDREGKPARELVELVGVDGGGAAMPDAGQATPDAGAERAHDAGPVGPDSALAPVDASGGPHVDAGPPSSVAGPWHVYVDGAPCPSSPALATEQRWVWDPTASTLATDSGTLSRVRDGVFEGITGGQWVCTLTLALDGEGFSGVLVRKGPSCSDRWDVDGVR